VFAFTSPLNPGNHEFAKELERHGDGVKDVAFLVDDAAGIHNKAVGRGAKSVRAPETLKDDNGSVVVSSV
jgi:4-hydroxyphenylpyruvate dioxygenase